MPSVVAKGLKLVLAFAEVEVGFEVEIEVETVAMDSMLALPTIVLVAAEARFEIARKSHPAVHKPAEVTPQRVAEKWSVAARTCRKGLSSVVAALVVAAPAVAVPMGYFERQSEAELVAERTGWKVGSLAAVADIAVAAEDKWTFAVVEPGFVA